MVCAQNLPGFVVSLYENHTFNLQNLTKVLQVSRGAVVAVTIWAQLHLLQSRAYVLRARACVLRVRASALRVATLAAAAVTWTRLRLIAKTRWPLFPAASRKPWALRVSFVLLTRKASSPSLLGGCSGHWWVDARALHAQELKAVTPRADLKPGTSLLGGCSGHVDAPAADSKNAVAVIPGSFA